MLTEPSQLDEVRNMLDRRDVIVIELELDEVVQSVQILDALESCMNRKILRE